MKSYSNFVVVLGLSVLNTFFSSSGDVILEREHIGSGVCLTMICSDICEIHNKTEVCTTPMPTPITTPFVPTCPEWDVAVRIFV